MAKKRAFLDECVAREELARLLDRNGHIYGHYRMRTRRRRFLRSLGKRTKTETRNPWMMRPECGSPAGKIDGHVSEDGVLHRSHTFKALVDEVALSGR
jgi:hypothetical protein